MSEDNNDDQEGLPDPTDQGADDPGAGESDGPADPWSPLDTSQPTEEPPTDRNEILQLINWCRDLEKQLLELRALINQTDAATGGTYESVTFTAVTGSGGTATSAANFTYNFTTADGVAHNGVSPAHQRLNAAKQATRGIWDGVRLLWTDEIPDPGGCN